MRSDLGILKAIELEDVTIEAAIRLCSEEDIYPEITQLIDDMGYYYHVRGMWDKKLIIHPMAAEFARRQNDRIEEMNALGKYVQVVCRQSD